MCIRDRLSRRFNCVFRTDVRQIALVCPTAELGLAVTSMNTKGPKKKKQHYVPKFYLRGFCGSGDTVFALDKESGGIFTPSVGDFCAERYLYESCLLYTSL